MNIFSQVKILPSLMNKFSSVFLASDDFIKSFLSADNFLTRLLKLLGQLIYFACKWIMYVVDVIYYYVLELAGVSADTSIFDSASSDMTFKMLIENKESVTTFIKNFIGIAIVIILVTAIIAIIKQQSTAFKDKKARKNPAGDVIKSVLKSLLLIVLTPLIALLGIVSSSVILQALFNATNLSASKSLSARVFNASASQANRYYIYASNGVRIPIKYKFSGDDKSNAINYTVKMVGNNNFPSLSYFNENEEFSNSIFIDPITGEEIEKNDRYSSATETWVNNTYYAYYDTSDSYSSGIKGKYKKFTTHSYEYFAMSDVICYALDTMEPFYFVTIQEMLESVAESVSNDEGGAVLKSLFESYKVRLLNGNGEETFDGTEPYTEIKDAIINRNYSYIKYISSYKNGDFEYVHIRDAVDEMEGAKYVIAYKVACNPEYTSSLNGSYGNADTNASGFLETGIFYEADKFYYKNSSNNYKKVDLYYFYDNDKEEYVKASTFNPLKEYYYKLGSDYHLITEEDKTKFYYKDNNNEFKQLVYGQNFFTLTTKFYYAPLSAGVSVQSGEYSAFTSEYIKPASLITARGIFDESGYPTAIRRIANGDIMFYRDDLIVTTDGKISDVGTLDQIEVEEGADEDQTALQKVGSFFKNSWNSIRNFASSLFNPLKLVPDLKIDESKVASTYTNETTCVYKIADGKLHISYFFADSLTSSLTKSSYTMNLVCLFDPMSINYVILAVGSIIFFKIVFNSVFALINRSLNLFIMILTYPVACATIPLDEADKKQKSGSYRKWMTSFSGLLFSTYGLILGMNFVFIIIPVIDKLEFFTAENFINNKALGRIGNALFNPWMLLGIDSVFTPNYALIARYVNKLLRIIFQIAAFSLIVSTDGKGDTFYTAIRDVVGVGSGVLEDNPMSAVKKTIKNVAQVVNMVAFPQKFVKDKIEHSKESLKKTVDKMNPVGKSSVIRQANDKRAEKVERETQDRAKRDLISAMEGGAKKEVVEAKLNAYKDAYKIK